MTGRHDCARSWMTITWCCNHGGFTHSFHQFFSSIFRQRSLHQICRAPWSWSPAADGADKQNAAMVTLNTTQHATHNGQYMTVSRLLLLTTSCVLVQHMCMLSTPSQRPFFPGRLMLHIMDILSRRLLLQIVLKSFHHVTAEVARTRRAFAGVCLAVC